MENTPHWLDVPSPAIHPALNGDLAVDVLVVGGGITGLTAALLLRRCGASVVLVDRGRIGGGDSGRSSAHLSYMTDTRLSDLIPSFGRGGAAAAWQAGKAAMETIHKLATEAGTADDLRTVPSYLVAAADPDPAKERALLQKEALLAGELGFDAEFTGRAPITGKPGILFPEQMTFDPVRYLHALAALAVEAGVTIHEHTPVTESRNDPNLFLANGHRIQCGHVVLATHLPLRCDATPGGCAFFRRKLSSNVTRAIAGSIPPGTLDEMIWSDTGTPSLFLRIDRGAGKDTVILGGEDHVVGKESPGTIPFQHLEDSLLAMIPDAQITRRWSGHVIETQDGLPYIGRNEEGQFIACGFSGSGMTFGTLSATMARDALMGLSNPWEDLFALDRKKLSTIRIHEDPDLASEGVTAHSGAPDRLRFSPWRDTMRASAR